MGRRFIFAILFSAVVAGYAGWWLRGQSDVDACLDAGGRWETRGSYCTRTVLNPAG